MSAAAPTPGQDRPEPLSSDGAERRSRLRQYQVQLMERMQAAKTSSAGSGKELGVLLGTRRCLLDLTQVGEIVPATAISAVPLTHAWYPGLANVRGNLTGVVDLARYRGEAPGVLTGESRLITFAPRLGFNCALLVTRVLGLRDLAELSVAPGLADSALPETVAPAWAEQIFIDGEARDWSRIDLSQLVREGRFLQVGL